jgi:hypothetical protein
MNESTQAVSVRTGTYQVHTCSTLSDLEVPYELNLRRECDMKGFCKYRYVYNVCVAGSKNGFEHRAIVFHVYQYRTVLLPIQNSKKYFQRVFK